MRWVLPILVVTCLLGSQAGWTQDMRAASQKAQEDRQEAEEAARTTEARILKDRETLLAEIERIEAREKHLEETLTRLEESIKDKEEQEQELSEEWSVRELQFQEIAGTVRIAARELETILRHSPFTAARPQGLERIQPLLQKHYFPGIDDIDAVSELFLEEAKRSGEVSLKEGSFVDRTGSDRQGRMLFLGKFSAIYEAGDEVGFLRYSEEGKRLYALSALPSWIVRRNLGKYLEGNAQAVYIDLSGGAALRQITHRPGLWEQILSGGPIVWPILALALLAGMLVLERIVYLNRVHGNTDRIMERMNRMAAKGEWKACDNMVKEYENRDWPVTNVLAAGLSARHETRETQESILQEAILREAPRLERSLSIIGIFGAIAPLLGLLGTVTGMIGTFRVITLYGTGDPRMMSGGISEALITTELGLAVAIPIMLLHTFLSRRVDQIIGEMEEKAVALTNIMQKEQRQDGQSVPGG